jgi:hypothetical protein
MTTTAAPAAVITAPEKPDLVARLEPRLGLFAIIIGGAALLAVPLPGLTLGIGAIFNAAGIQLLAQGLGRDLWILARRRLAPTCGEACVVGKSVGLWRRLLGRAASETVPTAPAKSAPVLCLESGLGAGLIAIGLLLMGAGATATVTTSPGAVVAVAGLWWLAGWALRDFVFELKRAPDHINVAVGFGGEKTGGNTTGT